MQAPGGNRGIGSTFRVVNIDTRDAVTWSLYCANAVRSLPFAAWLGLLATGSAQQAPGGNRGI